MHIPPRIGAGPPRSTSASTTAGAHPGGFQFVRISSLYHRIIQLYIQAIILGGSNNHIMGGSKNTVTYIIVSSNYTYIYIYIHIYIYTHNVYTYIYIYIYIHT